MVRPAGLGLSLEGEDRALSERALRARARARSEAAL